jgi:type II secretion system protein H
MRRGGFTLIELVIVVTLIATLGALVLPRLTGSQARARVEAQARAIVALAQTARARAAGEGRAYLLMIDVTKHEARLSRRRDPLAEPADPEDPEREAADLEASWSRAVPFEEGVHLVEGPQVVTFRPSGEADAATLAFEGPRGDRVSVVVDPTVGRCSIAVGP